MRRFSDAPEALRRAALFVGTLLLVACSDPMTVEPIDELPRSLSTAEIEVIDASGRFGFELLAETVVRDHRANVVLSPLSASMALGMTLNGAGGTTFDAMRSTLSFEGMDQAEVNRAYADLIELLTTLDPTVRLELANAVWTEGEIPFHDDFLTAVAEAFDARTESADFSDPAVLDAINRWVRDNTDGAIDGILESIPPDLVALLLNAVYFDGAWTTEFDPADTHTAPFTRADGSTVDVRMMSLSDTELPYSTGPEHQAVELPYGGGAFSMVIVVPSGDARSFAASLDLEGWARIVEGLSPTELDGLALPRFEVAYDGLLNDALAAMGMADAFETTADFTRMSPLGDRICLSFVRQKTLVEVDERGTRAAAVTAVGPSAVSFTGLIADRPFVFAIRERLSGTLLFTGLIGDPTATDPGPTAQTAGC